MAIRVQFGEAVDRLTKAYPKLSPQLKKCASYILEHPSEVATFSMRELATKADVPYSTLNRLARALDFRTYGEFKALLRDSINEQTTGYSLESGQVHVVARESNFDDGVDAFQQAVVNNINTLFDRIDRTALERAVQALTDARTVLVVGMYESHLCANRLHYVAAARFRNWHLLIPNTGDYSRLLGDLAPADVVVCIAVEPYAANSIRIAERAREARARVIGITDRRTSPLAACSDDVLLISVDGLGDIPSHVGATALVELLVGMVAARSGYSAAAGADKSKRTHGDSDEFWSE